MGIGGVSPDDLAVLAELRHQCFVKFTETLIVILRRLTPLEFQEYKAEFAAYFVAVALRRHIDFLLFDRLTACLAFADAAEAVLTAKASAAAASSCGLASVNLSLAGSGSKTRLKSFRLGRPNASKPLQVSCTATAGGLAISVTTRSKHTSLSTIVGSKLRLGIVRSRTDPAGGQLSVTFRHP